MIPKILHNLLNEHEYLILSTTSKSGKPNAAPMFLAKLDNKCVYCIDYALGTTFRNLKANPKVSIAVVDIRTLKGFKLNCDVAIISSGPQFKKLATSLEKKTLQLTTQRVIDGIRKKIMHKDFEIGILEKFVIYKAKVKEIVEIGPQGRIRARKL